MNGFELDDDEDDDFDEDDPDGDDSDDDEEDDDEEGDPDEPETWQVARMIPLKVSLRLTSESEVPRLARISRLS